MSNLYNILKKPIVTEKTSILLKKNKITFEVHRSATKNYIKEVFKVLFNMKKINVRTLISRGKIKKMGKYYGKRKNRKKAIITLEKKYNANQIMSQK